MPLRFRRFAVSPALLAACFIGLPFNPVVSAGEPVTSPKSERALDSAPVQQLETLRVTATKPTPSETAGPEPVEHYGSEEIYDSGAFDVNEFIDSLPPAEEGEEVLVLIDGQPTYLDPASLPLSMIQDIEVSRDGSMPEYGAYANGRVINIRTKQNYSGGEASGQLRWTAAGGGGQQSFKLSGVTTRGKLRAFIALDHAETRALSATRRAFSNEQDHTPWGGHDLRLAWGYPAVVQAVTGNLYGLTDAAGGAVYVALVPENQDGAALLPTQFIPGAGPTPASSANQRKFNTAAFRTLVAPSSRTGGNMSLTYALAKRVNIALTASYSETHGERAGPPPVTPVSSHTLVPAAFNPFGQDVEVGLVHLEFGPVRESSHTDAGQIGLKLNGQLGETWSWNSGIAYRVSESRHNATDLDRDKFAAALAATDPAQRFNPFGDARVAALNARLYPALTVVRTRRDTSRDARLDFGANGQLLALWGGPMTLSLRANASDRRQERVNRNPTSTLAPDIRQTRTSASVAGSVTLPLVGPPNARPFLRRLTTRLSTKYSQRDDEDAGHDAAIGLVWVPAQPLAFRAKYSTNTTNPPRTVIAGAETLVSETLLDRARGDLPVSNVEIFNRGIVVAVPARSERASVGATLEPTFLKGFRLSTSYTARRRHHILQRSFDAQEIINNEAAFPGRVIRAAADASVPGAGTPGSIVAVDITPGNSGEAETRDVDFSLDYRLPWQQLGRFKFSAFAQRVLESRYEIVPGVPYVQRGSGRANPPDWIFHGNASWNRAGWTLSGRVRYTGPVVASSDLDSSLSSFMTVDLNAGYRFRHSFGKKSGDGLRVSVGIANFFDRPPPLADTIAGYRNGSPLGRTYTCAVTLPL